MVGGLRLRFAGSLPHRRNQSIQHATDPGDTCLNSFVFGPLAIANTKRNLELHIDLALRAKSNLQMVKILESPKRLVVVHESHLRQYAGHGRWGNDRGTRPTDHQPPTTYGKIFPGFRIPAGSNAAFTRFMSAI